LKILEIHRNNILRKIFEVFISNLTALFCSAFSIVPLALKTVPYLVTNRMHSWIFRGDNRALIIKIKTACRYLFSAKSAKSEALGFFFTGLDYILDRDPFNRGLRRVQLRAEWPAWMIPIKKIL
jgi:hypothetical protein